MHQTHLLNFYNEFIIKQDYFECHEIMEEQWKEKERFTKKDPEVFLILIATAEYHYRRGNLPGAETSYKRALKLFMEAPFMLGKYGLSESAVEVFKNRLQNINYVKFKVMEFPLSREYFLMLQELIMPEASLETFKVFIDDLKVLDEQTVHKHKMRDRTPVIAERLQSLKNKNREE